MENLPCLLVVYSNGCSPSLLRFHSQSSCPVMFFSMRVRSPLVSIIQRLKKCTEAALRSHMAICWLCQYKDWVFKALLTGIFSSSQITFIVFLYLFQFFSIFLQMLALSQAGCCFSPVSVSPVPYTEAKSPHGFPGCKDHASHFCQQLMGNTCGVVYLLSALNPFPSHCFPEHRLPVLLAGPAFLIPR